ncbi:MAG: tRNA guanosine(34) transglycosylase Tgt, partial [Terriglobales bacterium]
MPVLFQIEATRGSARTGKLITPHGEVETPVFMPVGTLGSVKGVSQDVLEELGVEILLTNTYHLFLRPGVETVRQMGGLHRFMSWDRAILTDSGGFQVFSLNDLRKVSEEGVAFRSHLDGSPHFLSPEKAMEIQIGLGADIIMAFDECTEYPADRQRVRDSMELTLRWAERCKSYFDEHKGEVPWARAEAAELRSAGQPRAAVPTLAGRTNASAPTWADQTQALFGIVQGGMDRDLRRESAER